MLDKNKVLLFAITKTVDPGYDYISKMSNMLVELHILVTVLSAWQETVNYL